MDGHCEDRFWPIPDIQHQTAYGRNRCIAVIGGRGSNRSNGSISPFHSAGFAAS